MYRYKRIALGLAAVALFVLAVTGVAALIGPPESVDAIQGSRRDWAAAIQAVSTVVVMGATIVYAAITYRMMQAMKQQTATMLATPTRAHVTELARYLMDWMNSVLALKRSVSPDWRSPVDRMAEQDQAIQLWAMRIPCWWGLGRLVHRRCMGSLNP